MYFLILISKLDLISAIKKSFDGIDEGLSLRIKSFAKLENIYCDFHKQTQQ